MGRRHPGVSPFIYWTQWQDHRSGPISTTFLNKHRAWTDRTPCGMKKLSSHHFFPCMSHCPAFGNHLTSLGHAVFRDNRIDGICAEKTLSAALHFSVAPSQRSSPQAISTVSCPSTLHSRSLPPELCPSCFQRFPVCSRCILAPPSKAFPKLFPMVFS